MINIKINENDKNQRIDRFLMKLMPNANKNFLMRMLREKKIKLNYKKVTPSYNIELDDEIQIYFSDETFNKFSKGKRDVFNKTKIDIIYEDKDVLIVDKPSGLLCHVAKNLKEKNLVDGVINYLYSKGEYNPRKENTFVPSICNRLDRNTSGLVIAAKNANALREINDLIKKREIKKFYLAIVRGRLNYNGILKNSYKKNESKNKMVVVDDDLDDKEMISNIKTVECDDNFSLINIELITGRTHQIRLQLNSLNHPIIGDNKYGEKEFNENVGLKHSNRQQLVACELVFPTFEGSLNNLSNKVFVSKYKNDLLELYNHLRKSYSE